MPTYDQYGTEVNPSTPSTSTGTTGGVTSPVSTYTDKEGNVHVVEDYSSQGGEKYDTVVSGFKDGYSGSGFQKMGRATLQESGVAGSEALREYALRSQRSDVGQLIFKKRYLESPTAQWRDEDVGIYSPKFEQPIGASLESQIKLKDEVKESKPTSYKEAYESVRDRAYVKEPTSFESERLPERIPEKSIDESLKDIETKFLGGSLIEQTLQPDKRAPSLISGYELARANETKAAEVMSKIERSQLNVQNLTMYPYKTGLEKYTDKYIKGVYDWKGVTEAPEFLKESEAFKLFHGFGRSILAGVGQVPQFVVDVATGIEMFGREPKESAKLVPAGLGLMAGGISKEPVKSTGELIGLTIGTMGLGYGKGAAKGIKAKIGKPSEPISVSKSAPVRDLTERMLTIKPHEISPKSWAIPKIKGGKIEPHVVSPETWAIPIGVLTGTAALSQTGKAVSSPETLQKAYEVAGMTYSEEIINIKQPSSPVEVIFKGDKTQAIRYSQEVAKKLKDVGIDAEVDRYGDVVEKPVEWSPQMTDETLVHVEYFNKQKELAEKKFEKELQSVTEAEESVAGILETEQKKVAEQKLIESIFNPPTSEELVSINKLKKGTASESDLMTIMKPIFREMNIDINKLDYQLQLVKKEKLSTEAPAEVDIKQKIIKVEKRFTNDLKQYHADLLPNVAHEYAHVIFEKGTNKDILISESIAHKFTNEFSKIYNKYYSGHDILSELFFEDIHLEYSKEKLLNLQLEIKPEYKITETIIETPKKSISKREMAFEEAFDPMYRAKEEIRKKAIYYDILTGIRDYTIITDLGVPRRQRKLVVEKVSQYEAVGLPSIAYASEATIAMKYWKSLTGVADPYAAGRHTERFGVQYPVTTEGQAYGLGAFRVIRKGKEWTLADVITGDKWKFKDRFIAQENLPEYTLEYGTKRPVKLEQTNVLEMDVLKGQKRTLTKKTEILQKAYEIAGMTYSTKRWTTHDIYLGEERAAKYTGKRPEQANVPFELQTYEEAIRGRPTEILDVKPDIWIQNVLGQTPHLTPEQAFERAFKREPYDYLKEKITREDKEIINQFEDYTGTTISKESEPYKSSYTQEQLNILDKLEEGISDIPIGINLGETMEMRQPSFVKSLQSSLAQSVNIFENVNIFEDNIPSLYTGSDVIGKQESDISLRETIDYRLTPDFRTEQDKYSKEIIKLISNLGYTSKHELKQESNARQTVWQQPAISLKEIEKSMTPEKPKVTIEKFRGREPEQRRPPKLRISGELKQKIIPIQRKRSGIRILRKQRKNPLNVNVMFPPVNVKNVEKAQKSIATNIKKYQNMIW